MNGDTGMVHRDARGKFIIIHVHVLLKLDP